MVRKAFSAVARFVGAKCFVAGNINTTILPLENIKAYFDSAEELERRSGRSLSDSANWMAWSTEREAPMDHAAEKVWRSSPASWARSDIESSPSK